MSIPRGDFIGFTIDGIHSSQLGIIRVSDGSRFTESLLPAFSDKTIQIPGGDGMYYFGREYGSRSFSINIAYDSLREEQIRKIRQIFYEKKTHELVFDEYPYKIFDVVIQNPPQIKFLCFDDDFGKRVYKGEGTLSFICYNPYAKAKYKFLEDYSGTITNTLPQEVISWYRRDSNLDEWIASSGIISKYQTVFSGDISADIEIDKFAVVFGNNGFYTYNPSDIAVPFKMAIVFPSGRKLTTFSLSLKEVSSGLEKRIVFDTITAENGDNGILIDGERGIVVGSAGTTAKEIFKNSPTKNLYNRCIKSGTFFDIPNTGELEWLACGASQKDPDKIGIQYNYKYL